MNIRNLLIVALLGVATAWSQTTTPQTPPAGSQIGSGSQHEHGQAGKAGERGAMHAQHMQQARADLTRMKSLLNQMRSSYASMDPKDQPAMQANIELWQLMVNHMDQMLSHMEQMGGMGHGMMHHEGMEHGEMMEHHGMGRSKETTPPPSTTKPKSTPSQTTPPQEED